MITWITFVACVQFQAAVYCNDLSSFETRTPCEEEIVECVLDGESLSWCTNDTSDNECKLNEKQPRHRII